MPNNNQFNVIKYKERKPTLDTIEIKESTARFSLNTDNTVNAFMVVDLKQLAAGTELIIELSGSPAMFDDLKTVHFAIKDSGNKTLEKRQEKFINPTPNDGVFIPIEYNESIEKIIIDIEVTGLNQETILNIGADFGSLR